METINFHGAKEKTPNGWILKGAIAQPPSTTCIGIDPGLEYGVTLIRPSGDVQILWGKIKRAEETGVDGVRAHETLRDIISAHGGMFAGWKGVVEGAAYFMPKGQVHLEEVRWAMYYALIRSGVHAKIMPPATIRKIAFDHGRKDAMDIWPWMNQNAADSVGCALAAMSMED